MEQQTAQRFKCEFIICGGGAAAAPLYDYGMTLNICALTSDLFMAQFRHGLCVCVLGCFVLCLTVVYWCAYEHARWPVSLFHTNNECLQ